MTRTKTWNLRFKRHGLLVLNVAIDCRKLLLNCHAFFHRYLNAIQTTCPHILRYLTTAVITNKRRRTVLKDLVKVIQQESYTYKDPITEFLECLYVNFDFDGAQKKLRECETVSGQAFYTNFLYMYIKHVNVLLSSAISIALTVNLFLYVTLKTQQETSLK